MKPFLKKIEYLADKLIVPALLAVLFIVVVELFFPDIAHDYHGMIVLLDNTVITIFVVDVAFKLHRASSWEGFLKGHWLEIIAIAPFALVFRILEGILIVTTDLVELSHHTAHLAEGAKSGRFAELFRASELTRSTRMARLIRAVSRSPRFAKAAQFFEAPEHESSLD